MNEEEGLRLHGEAMDTAACRMPKVRDRLPCISREAPWGIRRVSVGSPLFRLELLQLGGGGTELAPHIDSIAMVFIQD